MGLDKGTRLGPYEIATPLGAGGMGEVYRARDTRLGREVAIKVLRPDAVQVTGRRERFVQEARAISTLQHPHICVLHDVGCEDGTDFLVMEYLEGETLAQRLAKGPLPLPELLRTGSEIADALDKAHRHGILHRDLKPANIMLTKAGAKLMDFGLAKTTAHVTASLASLTQPVDGPTAPVTAEGTLIGTYPYMAPEQLEGNPADARSDIFALGAVLYEMASGRQAFAGKTRASVMAAILERQPPPLSSLQPLTPPALERTVQGCLAKDPEERFQSAHDVKLQLDWIRDAGSQAGGPAPGTARGRSRQPLVWAVAAAVLLAAGFIAGHFLQMPPAVPAVISEIAPPPGMRFASTDSLSGPSVISPDGRRLAFVATDSAGTRQLWVRPLDSAASQPLAGTEGAEGAIWSPDSRHLAFRTASGISSVATSGGPAVALAPTAASPAGARGASWGPNGILIGSPTPISPLFGLPASGGAPFQITQLDKTRLEIDHRWPQFLPDGRHFLYYAFSAVAANSGTYAASLDGGAPKLVLHGDSNAVYALPGYLLFVNQDTLMAQPFDPDRLSLSGDAMPLASNAAVSVVGRHGIFSVSQNGVLVYETGTILNGSDRIVWLDRAGKPGGDIGEAATIGSLSLSPNGGKLAVSLTDAAVGKPDIWVFDLARGVRTRLTLSSAVNVDPVWSPDGKSIAFLSSRSGRLNLYQIASDGTGNPTALAPADAAERSPAWTADAQHVFFARLATAPSPRSEIWEVPLGGDKKPHPILRNPQLNFMQPSPSPDGKWLAYVAQDSGRPQVFVVPFPMGSGRWQISTDGGMWPKWRHDGAELFYRSLDSEVMSASIVKRAGSLVVGKAQVLFQANFAPGALGAAYDVSPDGKRFVMAASNANAPAASVRLMLVTHWPALLKKP